MNKKIVAIILGIMCIILTASIVIQYKTVSNASQIAGTSINSELKTEVLRWKEKYEEIYSELGNSEQQLEEIRELASNNDTSSSQLQQQLKTLNALIGTTDVQGPGIVITIADNSSVTSENIGILDNISNYLVHDKDLLILVNELKNAGAEAISINDERIINTTSITCDGNVILINDNKVSSPFIIKVIGSQETLLGAIERPGGFLDQGGLYRFGLVSSIEKQDKVQIYKYKGVINYKSIKK